MWGSHALVGASPKKQFLGFAICTISLAEGCPVALSSSVIVRARVSPVCKKKGGERSIKETLGVLECSMSVISIDTAVSTARRYSPKEYYQNSLRMLYTPRDIHWTIGVRILVLEVGLSSYPPTGH